jgi:sn-1 stearoyl-lipid 9-desaturase
MGSLNFLDGPITWCGMHRLHHAHTDEDSDPHSPKQSFLWGHCGWFFYSSPIAPRNVCGDLNRDEAMIAIERYAYAIALGAAVLVLLSGAAVGGFSLGMSWLLWGVCLRAILVFHSAGLVNSVCHRWGYRRFDTPDDSRNSWWVALLSLGEGWHNNHHKYQRCAAHGFSAGEFDITYRVICVLRRLGLAWDVVQPDPAGNDSMSV